MDKFKNISASVRDLRKIVSSVSERDLTKCSTHKKTLIKAVFCHEHDSHNTVVCEDCEIECKCECNMVNVIAEFKQYHSDKEIDKGVADECLKIHKLKLCLLSKLGRNSEELSIDNSSQHIASSTENAETLKLCKEISKANCLEVRFTKEIIPFIKKKKKTPFEVKVYFWKAKCLRQSLKLANLEEPETSADSEYLTQFEEFMYKTDIFVRNADKIQRAFVYDTAQSQLSGKFISRLKRQMIKEKIELNVCEDISEIADQYEPIIVVCLLDTRHDSNICYALSCVKAIDNRRIGFISYHCKSNDIRNEDFTESETMKIFGTKYKDLGMVIDWYYKQDFSHDKSCLDKVKKFLENCQKECTGFKEENKSTETCL